MKLLKYGLLIVLSMASHSIIAMNALRAKQDTVAKEQPAADSEKQAILAKIGKIHNMIARNTITSPYLHEVDLPDIDSSISLVDESLSRFTAKFPDEDIGEITKRLKLLKDYRKDKERPSAPQHPTPVEPTAPAAQQKLVEPTTPAEQPKEEKEGAAQEATPIPQSDQDIIKAVAQELAQKEEDAKTIQDATNKWLHVATYAVNKINDLNAAEDAGKINADVAERSKKAYAAYAFTISRDGMNIKNSNVQNALEHFKKYITIPEAIAYRFNFWRQEEAYQHPIKSSDAAYLQWWYLVLGARRAITDLESYNDADAREMRQEYIRQAQAVPETKNIAKRGKDMRTWLQEYKNF